MKVGFGSQIVLLGVNVTPVIGSMRQIFFTVDVVMFSLYMGTLSTYDKRIEGFFLYGAYLTAVLRTLAMISLTSFTLLSLISDMTYFIETVESRGGTKTKFYMYCKGVVVNLGDTMWSTVFYAIPLMTFHLYIFACEGLQYAIMSTLVTRQSIKNIKLQITFRSHAVSAALKLISFFFLTDIH
eukprot:snap_masked-scaffold_1-processed-gene-3.32-mRNA-1 protein AED:1.00 eAED:1.00 QI:0/0/0/0/1/1/3/0/182